MKLAKAPERTTMLLLAVAAGLPMLAGAFKNASPHILLSSSELPSTLPPITSRISDTPTFLTAAKAVISECNSDVYVIVNQPELSARDMRNERAMPHLKREIERVGEGRKVLQVEFVKESKERDVVEELEESVRRLCEAESIRVEASTGHFPVFDNMKPKVVRVDFPALPEGALGGQERMAVLKDHDAFLYSILTMLPSHHTIIFTSTPAHSSTTHPPSLVTQTTKAWAAVKRSLVGTSDTPSTLDSNSQGGNLLSNYQFFSDGIMMGYVGVFFLLVILLGALNSITSLQVSYAAFEKENGPGAAKKAQ